jgi:hypothetical protein
LLVILIHSTVLVAFRSQVFALAVAWIVKLPPAAATLAPLDEKVNAHGAD